MKKNISKIDENFIVSASLGVDDVMFYDIRNEPFKVYGLYNYVQELEFKRMPDKIARATSEGVGILNRNTAGGRVRFKTSSPYIAIKVKMPSVTFKPHMTLAGSSGFDLYINKKGMSTFYKTFMPPVDMKNGYESIIYFNDNTEKDLTVNFPLYNDVTELYIGLQQASSVTNGAEYNHQTPVVFYGSSITQGGCASRPGNCYPAIISRKIDCDYINLGFSGNAKGEDIMADYVASLNMSVFVYDYDHNAPDIEYLVNTHERMFKRIRTAQPELPIIIVSRPDFYIDIPCDTQRRNVIYSTYINAINAGDKNVYYIDGQNLFKDENRDSCTVDGCHPNDLGFMRMAEVIGYIISTIILK